MRSSLTLFALAGSLSSANLLNLNSKATGGCNTMCQPLMELTSACGSDTNCVCNNESFDVQTVGGACVSCLQQSNVPNDSLSKLAAACQFEAVSYAPQMTVLAKGIQVNAKETAPMAAVSTTSGALETTTISMSGMTTTMTTSEMSAGMTMTITMSGMTMTTTMSSSTSTSMSRAERTSPKGGMKVVVAVSGSALIGFIYALL